jgi:hypothetical protein
VTQTSVRSRQVPPTPLACAVLTIMFTPIVMTMVVA